MQVCTLWQCALLFTNGGAANTPCVIQNCVWLQVLTSQQCAMLLVYAYPYLSDISAAMNALAELEGQPSVAEVAAQATAALQASACLQIQGKLQYPPLLHWFFIRNPEQLSGLQFWGKAVYSLQNGGFPARWFSGPTSVSCKCGGCCMLSSL